MIFDECKCNMRVIANNNILNSLYKIEQSVYDEIGTIIDINKNEQKIIVKFDNDLGTIDETEIYILNNLNPKYLTRIYDETMSYTWFNSNDAQHLLNKYVYFGNDQSDINIGANKSKKEFGKLTKINNVSDYPFTINGKTYRFIQNVRSFKTFKRAEDVFFSLLSYTKNDECVQNIFSEILSNDILRNLIFDIFNTNILEKD
jgi:hypothetical protein